MEELTKTQILARKIIYPSNLVKLVQTKHSIGRLEERGIGLDCIPTMVRITEDNLHSGKTKDGKRLASVVIKLRYNSRTNIFLAFNPYDGACKTLWFRERRSNESRRRRADVESTQQAV